MELFFLLLGFLSIVFLLMGKHYSRHHANMEEFFIGKRDLGLFGLTMTFFAAQIGGGALLGTAEEAYKQGLWGAIAYPAGLVLGMLAIASGFGAKLRKLELVTVSQVFETLYGSKRLRSVASSLFILSLFCILVAQATAARKFFYALGFDSPWLFLVSWAILIFYSSLGGLKAAIGTDIVQGIVKLLSLGTLFVIAALWNSPQTPIFTEQLFLTKTTVPWVDWLLMPLFFMLIAQDMGQRCFAATSPQTVSKAAYLSALIFSIVSFVPIYLGLRAKDIGLEIPEGHSVFLESAKIFTNPYATALCAVGVLMALISISNSLLCSISSQMSYDFAFVQTLGKERSTNLAKWLTAGIGGIAALASYGVSNIIPLLVLSYELSVSVLFVPIFAILIGKPMSKNGVLLSMFLGSIAYGLGSYGLSSYGVHTFGPGLSLTLFGFPPAISALLISCVPLLQSLLLQRIHFKRNCHAK
jgi:SSS family solute:Na+ symporter